MRHLAIAEAPDLNQGSARSVGRGSCRSRRLRAIKAGKRWVCRIRLRRGSGGLFPVCGCFGGPSVEGVCVAVLQRRGRYEPLFRGPCTELRYVTLLKVFGGRRLEAAHHGYFGYVVAGPMGLVWFLSQGSDRERVYRVRCILAPSVSCCHRRATPLAKLMTRAEVLSRVLDNVKLPHPEALIEIESVR